MNFSLDKSIEVLQNTPHFTSALLQNLSPDWTTKNEGESTWNAKEVLAHLIVCEETDWIPRARIILSESSSKTFTPIDMEAHFAIAKNNTLEELLKEFKKLRKQSIIELLGYNLNENDYKRTAIHPKIGEVNLQQLIATWVTHDLTHIAQIVRVIA